MAEQEKTETQENTQEKAAPPPQEKQEKAAKEKKGDRSQNCTQCKKRLSRKQWYYRDGNTFCSKGCWRTYQETKEKKAA